MERHGFLFGNAKGPFKTEDLTDVFIRESQKRIGFRMTNRDYRHIAIAIDRKFIRPNEFRLEEEDDDDDDDEDNPYDQMATHSTRTANKVYARVQGLTRSLTPESIDIFRDISDRWQRYYKLVSRLERDEEDAVVEEEIKTLTNDEKIKKATRKMYGASFKWRSAKQEEAVKAVVEGVSPLIVVLPTSAGKSLTFMLPATFDDAGTTVVICPTRALADNLLKRCGDAGIDAITWSNRGDQLNRYTCQMYLQ
jgi:DEAD/DEAH box helicase